MPIDRDGDGPPLRRPESKVSLTPGEGRGADLRATPFTDDVLGDDYYGRRPPTSEGSKSFSVIVGVVLGVAVAGGAGYYILRGNGGLQFTPNTVGFIKADPSPYKIRPDNPGGLNVPNQDKLVYDRVAKGDAPKRVENLLPPVEEPKAPPIKQPEATPTPAPPPEPVKVEVAKADTPAAPAKAEAPKVEPAKADVAKAEAPKPAKIEVAKAEPAKVEAPKPEPAKGEAAKPKEPAKREAPEADPLAAAVAAATGGREAATGPIRVAPSGGAAEKPAAQADADVAPKVAAETSAPAKVTPAKETQVAAAVPAPPMAAVAPASGPGFQIQLASVLSEEAAMAEWKRVSGSHKDLLGAYQPQVSKADLGDRGVFFRLRTGPLPDKAAADALCASLAAAHVGCIVVKP